jgi:hypothetical protein
VESAKFAAPTTSLKSSVTASSEKSLLQDLRKQLEAAKVSKEQSEGKVVPLSLYLGQKVLQLRISIYGQVNRLDFELRSTQERLKTSEEKNTR